MFVYMYTCMYVPCMLTYMCFTYVHIGGLSGLPVYELSTNVLRDMYQLTDGKIPIIGVGGIDSAQHAYNKIKMVFIYIYTVQNICILYSNTHIYVHSDISYKCVHTLYHYICVAIFMFVYMYV